MTQTTARLVHRGEGYITQNYLLSLLHTQSINQHDVQMQNISCKEGFTLREKMKGIKIKMIAGAQMLVMNVMLLTEFNQDNMTMKKSC